MLLVLSLSSSIIRLGRDLTVALVDVLRNSLELLLLMVLRLLRLWDKVRSLRLHALWMCCWILLLTVVILSLLA